MFITTTRGLPASNSNCSFRPAPATRASCTSITYCRDSNPDQTIESTILCARFTHGYASIANRNVEEKKTGLLINTRRNTEVDLANPTPSHRRRCSCILRSPRAMWPGYQWVACLSKKTLQAPSNKIIQIRKMLIDGVVLVKSYCSGAGVVRWSVTYLGPSTKCVRSFVTCRAIAMLDRRKKCCRFFPG